MVSLSLNPGQVERVLLALVSAGVAHLAVIALRRAGLRFATSHLTSARGKLRTLASLVVSTSVFVMYFVAIGVVLREFGISVTAYLASASIIGLAVGFGSQGLVQDVVTGLTVVFSNLFDVGDMVEIGGQTGIVQELGMRFTVLTNFMGARVYIPNRTIANVVTYPRGYVRALLDVNLPATTEAATLAEEIVRLAIQSAHEQFPGILVTSPSVEGRFRTSSGKEYLRVKFRIWPGQGGPLEARVRPELVQALRALDPAYADWMVGISYEVEQKTGGPPNQSAQHPGKTTPTVGAARSK